MRTKNTFRLPPDLGLKLADYASRKRVKAADSPHGMAVRRRGAFGNDFADSNLALGLEGNDGKVPDLHDVAELIELRGKMQLSPGLASGGRLNDAQHRIEIFRIR